MGTRDISIAVTPNGLADAITPGPDGKLYFVEPCIEKMTMEQLLQSLHDPEGDVRYLQSQNGNLFSSTSFYDAPDSVPTSEFAPLLDDLPKEVPWCSEALGQKPDAVNIWIGDERSVTSIHSDPYENIYTVIRGEKEFLLLPPTDSWCLKERLYPHATYSRQHESGTLRITPSGPDSPEVRWSSVLDPTASGALPKEVTPIRVTLRPGHSLYLPVGWWHYVHQSGLTIALNWWYDAEMRGMTWTTLNFLRNVVPVAPGN
ncbi:Clavaminate synthase-like protein [Agrocybe pediades]|nr:Clavaminate synthase-like protein [Agrocybe pediades]